MVGGVGLLALLLSRGALAAPLPGWVVDAGPGTAPGPALPRGVRNHNPLNIELTGDRWQGMAAEQSDGRYVVFVAPEWGFRAAAIILRRYRDAYGLLSVTTMIGRWAPPDENPTLSYAARVAYKMGVSRGVDLSDAEFERLLPDMLEAMAAFENGGDYFAAADIDRGLALA